MSYPTSPPPLSNPPSGAPPRPPGQHVEPPRRPWRVAGVVIGVLFVLVFAAVALLAVLGQAERDEEGAISDAGDLGVLALRVGDCFDEPSAPSTGEVVEVFTVDAKPCSEPHDSEVFHTYELTADELPSDDAVTSEAGERCMETFESYVGSTYEESELDFSFLWPTSDSWDAGERTVMCSLRTMNGSKLEGSAAGSGR
jgi:hypothetical protein